MAIGDGWNRGNQSRCAPLRYSLADHGRVQDHGSGPRVGCAYSARLVSQWLIPGCDQALRPPGEEPKNSL